jgi:hypothetical protein
MSSSVYAKPISGDVGNGSREKMRPNKRDGLSGFGHHAGKGILPGLSSHAKLLIYKGKSK